MRLVLDRLMYPPEVEEQWFMGRKELSSKHEWIIDNRLIFLEAFKAAVHPVLEEQLDKESSGHVLEVGCGTGFFSRFLAPSWLKAKLTSFDINNACLATLGQKDGETRLFQASVYNLPLPDRSMDAVIGYSSFDSFLHLTQAIFETRRILKPSGKLLLFQDLTTNLYDSDHNLSDDEQVETVERYHTVLVEELERWNFRILQGKEDFLDGVGVASLKSVRQRVPSVYPIKRPWPIVATWDRGVHRPPLGATAGFTQEENERAIDKTNELLKKRPYFKKLMKKHAAQAGDIMQFVKMRYLVAQKLS